MNTIEDIRESMPSGVKSDLLIWLLEKQLEQAYQSNFDGARLIEYLIDELFPESVVKGSRNVSQAT